MSVAATGPISLALENLRTLIANCSSFQDWTDSADADAAMGSVFAVAVNALTPPTRPFAIVGHIGNWSRSTDAIQSYRDSGSFGLLFEADITAGYKAIGSEADAEYEFTNAIGAIIDEMGSLQGQEGYLAIQRISVTAGPMRSDEQLKSSIEGDFYQILLRVDWE